MTQITRIYDATKEFAPIEKRDTKTPSAHPRARHGKTAKQRKRK